MRALIAAPLLLLASPLLAEVHPMPSEDSPRIQTIKWERGQRTILTALPETALTVMLEPGDSIQRVTLGNDLDWDVKVSPEFDSLSVIPTSRASATDLLVETGTRRYEFQLESEISLLAAYLVKFDYSDADKVANTSAPVEWSSSAKRWSYQMRGDRSVRPASISDDGVKTRIIYDPGQPLPAVFAIGASGDEEVVDGHMRNDEFIIDRVHERLVFRIDKERATARRNAEMDGVQ